MIKEILFLILIWAVTYEKPMLVIDFLRHGARSPFAKHPFWKNITYENPAQLMTVGQRMHNMLGRLRRSQYIEKEKFLPEEYDPTIMSFYATRYNRTVMSLQSYLMGLYPNGYPLLNDYQKDHAKSLLLPKLPITQIGEQVIELLDKRPTPFNLPVHAFTTKESFLETMLVFESCPSAEAQMQKNYYKSGQYMETVSRYSKLWEELISLYPEITMDYIRQARNAVEICDFTICADSEGKRPYKISDKMLKEMHEFIGTVMIEEYRAFPLWQNITMNGFSNIVVSRMDERLNNITPIKYAVYSAHDTGLLVLLLGLHAINNTIYPTQRPDFAANMLFELDDAEDHKVSIYFNSKLIHKEAYETFREKWLAVGNLTSTREEACKLYGTNEMSYENTGIRNYHHD